MIRNISVPNHQYSFYLKNGYKKIVFIVLKEVRLMM